MLTFDALDRASVDWMAQGACRAATSVEAEAFFWPTSDGEYEEREPDYPSEVALRFCDNCFVKAECLTYALERGLVGVWGGTSSAQRRAMNRVQHRSRCPGCGSDDVVNDRDKYELCLRCGVSWEY